MRVGLLATQGSGDDHASCPGCKNLSRMGRQQLRWEGQLPAMAVIPAGFHINQSKLHSLLVCHVDVNVARETVFG